MVYKPGLIYEHLDLNHDHPALADPRVRQSLLLAIDLVFLFAPCHGCDDKTGEYVGAISLGAISGILMVPFLVVAGVRRSHREWLPTVKLRIKPAGSGPRIEF